MLLLRKELDGLSLRNGLGNISITLRTRDFDPVRLNDWQRGQRLGNMDSDLLHSHFGFVPRGDALFSYRLTETMQARACMKQIPYMPTRKAICLRSMS